MISRTTPQRLAAAISLIYLVISVFWIALSDTLLATLIKDPAVSNKIQTIKGWFFVSGSALLIYLLIQRYLTALLHSEAHFRDLFRANPQPMWVYDLESLAFLEVNDTAVSRYGYRRDEFLSMHITDIRPPEDVPALLENLAKPREDVQFSGQWRHRFKNGTIIYVEITSHKLTYAGRSAVLVIAEDVTERRRAEIANARLISMLEATPDLVAMADESGSLLYLNPAGRKLLEVDETEALHDHNFDDFHTQESINELHLNALPKAVASGVWQGELVIKSLSGRIIPASQVILHHPRSQEESPYFSTIARDITEARNARAEIMRQLQRLEALRVGTAAITNNLDLPLTLDVILDQVINQLQIDAAVVLLHDPVNHTLDYAAGRGFATTLVQDVSVYLESGRFDNTPLDQVVHIPDLPGNPVDLERAPMFQEERFITYFSVPLQSKGQLLGLLELFHRSRLDPDPNWIEFMRTLAHQAAIALDNANLFARMQRYNQELTLAYEATIFGWSRAMELRDDVTEGHTRRVADVTVRLARFMGSKDSELVHIRHGALLHDIGKMAVPDSILKKPGPLTEEELLVMQRHPVHAYEMLSEIAYLQPALDIPYCHHEHWDGSGYPRGLKKEQIPLAARIFAVVDVWDAVTHDRPYRPRWKKEAAWEYLMEQSDLLFDPGVVSAFGRFVLPELREIG